MNCVQFTLAHQVAGYIFPSPEGTVLMTSPFETGDGNPKSPPPSIVGLLRGATERSPLRLNDPGCCIQRDSDGSVPVEDAAGAMSGDIALLVAGEKKKA